MAAVRVTAMPCQRFDVDPDRRCGQSPFAAIHAPGDKRYRHAYSATVIARDRARAERARSAAESAAMSVQQQRDEVARRIAAKPVEAYTGVVYSSLNERFRHVSGSAPAEPVTVRYPPASHASHPAEEGARARPSASTVAWRLFVTFNVVTAAALLTYTLVTLTGALTCP